MKKISMIIGAILMLLGLNSQAQLPYEKDYMYEIGSFGKTGTIKEFVSYILAEPEDEMSGPMSEAWNLYLQNKPLPEGVTILLDEKNGYFRYDKEYVEEFDAEEATEIFRNTIFVEMVVWNCADGKHKVFAENTGGAVNGVPHDEWEYDGIIFYLYDKATHKLVTIPDAIDIDEIASLAPSKGYEFDGEQWYYANDHVTGKRIQMDAAEFSQWFEDRPVVELSLPRTGKNIKATVYSVKGKEEREFVWDGYRFHLAK